jgi:hypothetical protein
MSGLLFLLNVAAFVLVVYWAYTNDVRPSHRARNGLFGMRWSATDRGRPRWRPVPSWKAPAPSGARWRRLSSPIGLLSQAPPRWMQPYGEGSARWGAGAGRPRRPPPGPESGGG